MFFQQCRTLRGVMAVASCAALVWCALGAPVRAQEPDLATQLYVRDMGVSYMNVGGPRRLAVAMVDIVDGNGHPVNDALVVGNWSGCFKQLKDSALTETVFFTGEDGVEYPWDGRATIWADKAHSCWGKESGCLFTFTITGVFKDGMTYVPINGMTSASCPCN